MFTTHPGIAGDTDPGRQRDVNEDRFHIDPERGIFIVVDGIGGQAAGGRAADLAITMLRRRLERETGPVADRIREAITVANNEICRVAATRAEWRGMACVMTVAVMEGSRLTIGHVGDTRLYKVRAGRLEKVTQDHSPVGEREDAGELSEAEAMRHPRRHEVFRDVGSEPHEPADADFVEILEQSFESDAAILLCSDGLTDLVPASAIAAIIEANAGRPAEVTRQLIAAANDAGGKDNVTVVYVEGDDFAAPQREAQAHAARPVAERSPAGGVAVRRPSRAKTFLLVATMLAAGAAIGWFLRRPPLLNTGLAFSVINDQQIVQPTESIMAALARARPGSEVVVEPGEYREQLVLKDQVRLVSRVPRAAVLRLPTTASESEAAVIASGFERAEISGFKIVGDSATPLGVGVVVRDAGVSIVDVEITGASTAAIDLSGPRAASLVGSEVHDNPGAALIVRAGAAPRVAQNAFARNGLSDRASRSIVVEAGARPQMRRNLFHGIGPELFDGLDAGTRSAVIHDNVFVKPSVPAAPSAPAPVRGAARGRR